MHELQEAKQMDLELQFPYAIHGQNTGFLSR